MTGVAAGIGLLALVAAAVLFYRSVFSPLFLGGACAQAKDGKGRPPVGRRAATKERYIRSTEDASAQDSLGLDDIVGPHIVMANGDVIDIIEVECKNASLNTAKEDAAEAEAAKRALIGIRGDFSVVYQQRHIDNSECVRDLFGHIDAVQDDIQQIIQLESTASARPAPSAAKAEKRRLMRRRDILLDRLAAEMAPQDVSQEQFQARVFVCIRTRAQQDSMRLAIEASRQAVGLFAENGFEARILNDLGAIDVLRAYFFEAAAPKENIDPYRQVPLYVKGAQEGRSEEC
jgi:hypothetical protein